MIESLKKFFFSFSLRTHLFLMVLLLSIPALALIVYTGFDERKDSLNEGVTETKMLVHGIITEQYNMTGDAVQLASVLALLPDVMKRNVPAVNDILSNIVKMNHGYSNINITDESGNVWASALPLKAGFSLKNKRSFQNAVKTGHFSSGEYDVDIISGKSTIRFGYPVVNAGGDFKGVIEVSLDFNHLNSLLEETGLPAGSLFTITDYKGVITYRNQNSDKFTGTRLNDDVFKRMKNGDDVVSFLDFGISEEGLINTYGKLRLRDEELPYLYVTAGIPLQETLVKAKRAQFFHLALVSPFLVAAVMLAALIGKYCFVDRINKLREASQRLALGDLESRVSDLIIGGELGELSRSFDEMARRLSSRESELISSQRGLHELNLSLTKRVEEETERRLQHERLLSRHARLAAIGEMIGAIAHQWRQPLAALGATIQSIRMAREQNCLDDSFLEKSEADAQKQLYYMSDTIEDFRNFFSPDKVVERFDVGKKIDEVVLLSTPQFANSSVSLRVIDNLSGRRLTVKGYQNEFKQSLLNLVSNAFDAIIDKTPHYVRADEEHDSHGQVVISLAAENRLAVIEVRDNGCGIPPEYADKVFEPYFTNKSGTKGTGIGLYMSRLIVEESMGGRLSFTSEPGGTVFKIELPTDEPGRGDSDG